MIGTRTQRNKQQTTNGKKVYTDVKSCCIGEKSGQESEWPNVIFGFYQERSSKKPQRLMTNGENSVLTS